MAVNKSAMLLDTASGRKGIAAFSTTVAGIVLGGLLGVITSLILDGYPWRIVVIPLGVTATMTVLVIIEGVWRESLVDSKLWFTMWFLSLLLLLLLSCLTTLPARRYALEQKHASAVESGQRAKAADASADAVNTRLAAIEKSIEALHKNAGLVKDTVNAIAAAAQKMPTESERLAKLAETNALAISSRLAAVEQSLDELHKKADLLRDSVDRTAAGAGSTAVMNADVEKKGAQTK